MPVTPFLQIIHISDLHMTDPRSPDFVAVRETIRKLRRYRLVLSAIVNMIDEGVAPHDPTAIALFAQFVDRIANQDPIWKKCKTWVVDTGDLTSLGDQKSLNFGRDYLAELAKFCPQVASIYGNHDAWPGELPLLVPPWALAQQIGKLTKLSYTVGQPGLLLETDIPHKGGKVQLFFVDSIVHDQWNNLRALGKVGGSQLAAFKHLVTKKYDPQRRDFRILAVHHPVHYPPVRPRLRMSMTDDRKVAQELGAPSTGGPYPLAHLVLSGHTHFLFPKHGGLPLEPSVCLHPDLGPDQCQFVVGSLMQMDRSQSQKTSQQCEVLRLYYSDDQSVLLLERLVAARQSGRAQPGTGIGPYEFVRLKQDNTKIEEPITFNLY